MSAGTILRLDATADRLRVYATVVSKAVEGTVSAQDLARELARRGVSTGVALETIGRLAGGHEPLPEGTRILVAEGRAAVHGVDGRVEHFVDVSSRPKYRENADGSLDFHETNLVHTVTAGQVLARLHPPTEGVPGRTVFGQDLPARSGKPARLRSGTNTELSADGSELSAKVAGRVQLRDGAFSVEPMLKVAGNVDYSVGNIRFPGTVEIGGSVLDGFEVQAGQGLVIHGTAGACTLKSDRDISVAGGVNGRGKAVLEAGGTVRSKYLNDATIRAGGDVECSTGIVNCQVRALGAVRLRQGAMIGGEAVVRGDVEVQILGSELGVTTRVTIGKDYIRSEETDLLTARAAAIDAELPALVKRLEAMADRKKFLAMPEAEREKVKGEYEHFKTLKAERMQIEERLRGAAAAGHGAGAAAAARLVVAAQLFPGVVVRGLQGCHTTGEAMRGPLTVTEESASGRMIFRPGTTGVGHGR